MSASPDLQFIDTNILAYAYDISAGTKKERAKTLVTSLWESGNGCVSIQVLQEFYVTMVQKIKQPLKPEVVSRIISDMGNWQVHAPDVSDILEAIQIQQRNQLSFWDSLIIRSAKILDCRTLWTEDLNHGQFYEGVEVLNPFVDVT
ncbi:MAG: PIN domain-containing protein [Firmicutes bacterium]|nr:PIN domain-containing protein [Bacillota bacterium]